MRRFTAPFCHVVDNIRIHPTEKQGSKNTVNTELIHVFCHRPAGLFKQKCFISKNVQNHREFLRIAVQQLVEEVRAGNHRLPNPGRPNQQKPLRRKVGPTVRAEPLVEIALDGLPHSIKFTVHMTVTNKFNLISTCTAMPCPR
ncbi:putative retrotransposon hot spot (RHS) protein [Trypanosoma cruzi]|nr:putative retrotransposon hot spot (RHS) protein [Trypanosoma cruzi]